MIIDIYALISKQIENIDQDLQQIKNEQLSMHQSLVLEKLKERHDNASSLNKYLIDLNRVKKRLEVNYMTL